MLGFLTEFLSTFHPRMSLPTCHRCLQNLWGPEPIFRGGGGGAGAGAGAGEVNPGSILFVYLPVFIYIFWGDQLGGGVILGGSAQQGGVAKKKKSPDFRCLEVGTSAPTMSTHVLPVVVDVASECTVDV